MVALILVDSNVWILVNIESYPECTVARPRVEHLARSDLLATNAVVLSEVYHKLSQMLTRTKAMAACTRLLENRLVAYLPIAEDTAGRAVELAAGKLLRINDAIIAQQALDERAALLTDDTRHFRKVPRLKILGLR